MSDNRPQQLMDNLVLDIYGKVRLDEVDLIQGTYENIEVTKVKHYTIDPVWVALLSTNLNQRSRLIDRLLDTREDV